MHTMIQTLEVGPRVVSGMLKLGTVQERAMMMLWVLAMVQVIGKVKVEMSVTVITPVKVADYRWK